MERILNDNEKIRKAEEIYFRRNNQNIHIGNEKNSSNMVNLKNKILLQLLIMFNIAVIVFAVQNKDYIFTQEFLGQIEQYNINITSKISEFLKNTIREEKEENKVNAANNKNVPNNATEENQIKENDIVPQTEVSSLLDEMEIDVQNLKAAYSFINPISNGEGKVSSLFGSRESEYQNVTGYHTGIDIAKEEGSVIKASIGGIVDLVSSEGDYGNHIKVRCNNVTTVYAHCSKIYVTEGQIVAQGQEIAAVGSTGNSTGPHLHFEIRVDDRFVDPAKIITF